MTNLYELSQKDDYLNLPQVSKSEIRLLWHSGYWDGPLSGLLLSQGEKYWFQLADERSSYDENILPRRFLIIELLADQLHALESWHEFFQEKVGTHTNYDEAGKRTIGALKPKELWNEFYEAYAKREQEDFSHNEVIGWFAE
jgi:hypothetical protein